jgi:hypothetical protein
MRGFTWRLGAVFSSIAAVTSFVSTASGGTAAGAASAQEVSGTGTLRHGPPAYRPPFNPRPSALPPVGGAWTQITSVPGSFFPGSMLVGLDGNVYIHEDNTGIWYKLTPDTTGSYVNGSWTRIADMPLGYQPLYFASQVLRGGKILIEGGEYNGSGAEVWTSLGAIYNTVTNTWTPVNPPTGWTDIGDAQSVMLPSGRFMMAHIDDGSNALFNEGTLTWTVQAGTGKADRNDEEGYQLLHNGAVLTINDEQALGNPGAPGSQIYRPSTGAWTDNGTLPVMLPHGNDEELGPMVLRPSGQVFAIGGTSHTAVWSPASSTWAAGPDLPGGYDGADAPAAILPNGHVLLAASPGLFQNPTHFWIYNGVSLTQTADTANAANDPSYVGRMVVLPTGQVMFDDGSGDLEVFTATGIPNPSWAPSFTWSGPTTLTRGTHYSLSGTQLSGVTTGASYGDDYQSSTNYPLVRITNTGNGTVTYGRTLLVGTYSVRPGFASTMTFLVTGHTPPGASTLEVVANGIASTPVNVTIN